MKEYIVYTEHPIECFKFKDKMFCEIFNILIKVDHGGMTIRKKNCAFRQLSYEEIIGEL